MLAAVTLTMATSAQGQAPGGVHVQVGSATAMPGAEVAGDAALYGLGGFRLEWLGRHVGLQAALYGGLSIDARGGDFASAVTRLDAWSKPKGRTGVGLIAEAYGFGVRQPFTYRTGTVRAGPGLRFGGSRASLELRGEAGFGATMVEGQRHQDAAVRRIDQDLWHYGARAEATLVGGLVSAVATGGVWSSAGGGFRQLSLALVAGGSRVAVRVDAGVWDTPLGSEWVGGLALVVPLSSAWSFQAVGGRIGPDPLTLVEAGGQGGALLSWRVLALGTAPRRTVHRLVRQGGETRVSFRVERSTATRVEVMGDFTAWEPRSLSRRSAEWTLDMVIPPGTYHYGFLVDGEWYVPEGQPGNVPDEWGRTNATLIVPEARD